MGGIDGDEDDMPVLSGAALGALQEFYADRDARKQHFEDLKAQAEVDESNRSSKLTMEAFEEDWNASQFWYSEETATKLAQQLLDGSTSETTIVVVSAPSVFVRIKNLLAEIPSELTPKLYLLEYDDRFSIFPEFVFYDFQQPCKLPPPLKNSADRIICDPPFLSDDCQTKAALTVRWLSKSWTAESADSTQLVVCTGERMETLVNRLYQPCGVATTTFEPEHAKGLSNEFYCFANFECPIWTWRKSRD